MFSLWAFFPRLAGILYKKCFKTLHLFFLTIVIVIFAPELIHVSPAAAVVRWWWVKVAALSDQRNFTELERLSKSKKSPVGYMSFVDACVRNNASDEAMKYVSKVQRDKQVAALCKIGWVVVVIDVSSSENKDTFVTCRRDLCHCKVQWK